MLNDLPELSRVYVSIGGGGLIAGVATALKQTRPDIRVIGVETVGADAMMAQSVVRTGSSSCHRSRRSRERSARRKFPDFTLHHVQQLVDEVIVVEDHEAFAALKFILERTKYLTEPAAACCLAAARRQRSTWRSDESIVILLCGKRIAADLCVWHERRFNRI